VRPCRTISNQGNLAEIGRYEKPYKPAFQADPYPDMAFLLGLDADSYSDEIQA
jgi:hypothetical protein